MEARRVGQPGPGVAARQAPRQHPWRGSPRGPTGGAALHTHGERSGLNLHRYIIQRMQTASETQIQTSS